jgi:FAD synthetase
MKKAKKVMVFGVFDLLHPGHLNFLVQAKELGDRLIVSVARDLNVFKVKGTRPVHGQKQRLKNLSLLPVVDKVVLGGAKDPWPHILKERPDIVALGYDQKIYIKEQGAGYRGQGRVLEDELHKRGLKKTEVVRLKPFWPQVYKSRILRRDLGYKL